jgi:hypothetical protein
MYDIQILDENAASETSQNRSTELLRFLPDFLPNSSTVMKEAGNTCETHGSFFETPCKDDLDRIFCNIR